MTRQARPLGGPIWSGRQMPELPEVETTRRGIEPHIEGEQVSDLIIRNGALRWPVPAGLGLACASARIM